MKMCQVNAQEKGPKLSAKLIALAGWMVTPKDSDPHFALLRRLDRGTLRCGILRVSNQDVHRNAPIARLFGSEIQWEKDIYKAQGGGYPVICYLSIYIYIYLKYP